MPDVGDATAPPALVAEDNAVNRQLLTWWFEKRGFTVVAVENGADAVQVLDEGRFDPVIMDVMMPKMDGLEATRAIRARERVRDGRVSVIALTALAGRGDPTHTTLAASTHSERHRRAFVSTVETKRVRFAGRSR